MNDVVIGNKIIGEGHPCFVIGEIGLNHNGDVEIVKRLIDASVEAGVDCVKLQKRNVSGLATNNLLDAEDNRFPEFGKTYREIREHLEFKADQYREIINYTRSKDILFLCTVFDISSVDFLEQFDVLAYKVASHSVTNLSLLEKLANTGKPVIISSGMCIYEELDRAINILSGKVPLVLLHCVSSYPQLLEESNLRLIEKYEERYGIPVGYSGHELGFFPTILSVARGAKAVERHITLDKTMVGFDHKLSLEPQELKDMVKEIRKTEQVLGAGEKFVSDKEQITRDKYHVSIVSACDLKTGEIVSEDKIEFKNPGTGLPPSRLNEILQKKVKQDVPKDTVLTLNMFGE